MRRSAIVYFLMKIIFERLTCQPAFEMIYCSDSIIHVPEAMIFWRVISLGWWPSSMIKSPSGLIRRLTSARNSVGWQEHSSHQLERNVRHPFIRPLL